MWDFRIGLKFEKWPIVRNLVFCIEILDQKEGLTGQKSRKRPVPFENTIPMVKPEFRPENRK